MVVGGGVGVHSHFRVQPNYSVEVVLLVAFCCRWGCDNTSHSGFPAEPSSQPARAKCVLSEQVQEIVKEGKVDFEKLLEAVRNDDFFNCRSENSAEEEDNYDNHDYENYPDEYWEML